MIRKSLFTDYGNLNPFVHALRNSIFKVFPYYSIMEENTRGLVNVRGRIEIIADILDNARTPSTKTSIVYGANLSFEQAGRYLDLLKDWKLLEEDRNDDYRITDRGIEFLSTFSELKNIIGNGGEKKLVKVSE